MALNIGVEKIVATNYKNYLHKHINHLNKKKFRKWKIYSLKLDSNVSMEE